MICFLLLLLLLVVCFHIVLVSYFLLFVLVLVSLKSSVHVLHFISLGNTDSWNAKQWNDGKNGRKFQHKRKKKICKINNKIKKKEVGPWEQSLFSGPCPLLKSLVTCFCVRKCVSTKKKAPALHTLQFLSGKAALGRLSLPQHAPKVQRELHQESWGSVRFWVGKSELWVKVFHSFWELEV